jgi:hypothetical protein
MSFILHSIRRARCCHTQNVTGCHPWYRLGMWHFIIYGQRGIEKCELEKIVYLNLNTSVSN